MPLSYWDSIIYRLICTHLNTLSHAYHVCPEFLGIFATCGYSIYSFVYLVYLRSFKHVYVYLYIVINDNLSAVWCKAKRSNVMSAYTFFTNLILNERVYFFLSKRLGKLVLKDIYYKFNIWLFIFSYFVSNTFTKWKKNAENSSLNKGASTNEDSCNLHIVSLPSNATYQI